MGAAPKKQAANLFGGDYDEDDEDSGFKMPTKAAPKLPLPPVSAPKAPAKPNLFNNDDDEEED
jgi:hypothetical protein